MSKELNYSYHDLHESDDPNIRLGAYIYMKALSDRRGFRDDQLEIFDEDIWSEIFEEIGISARGYLSHEL